MGLISGVRNRREFLRSASLVAGGAVFAGNRNVVAAANGSVSSATDSKRMRALADWTKLTMQTPNPVPYAAEIFDSKTGESLMRATNAVGPENDPSAHGEVRTIRLACKKLGSSSLRGYTLYTTCEPCPMCMSCCLWSRLDRVVYGATVADAARFGDQILISSREVEQHSSMHCVVTGPIERAHCLELFTNPTMQAVFKKWRTSKD